MQAGRASMGRTIFRGSFLACLAALALMVLGFFSAFAVQDDSYMFVRYADNLLSGGALSWDPGGQPTYGMTSLLYLAVVVPVRAVFSDNAVLAALVSSTLCGFLFLVVIHELIKGLETGRAMRRALLVLALFTLAAASRHLAIHFVSGMDTTFAMAYVGLLALAWRRLERSPGPRAGIALGVLGGLAWGVRPDLAVFGLGIPAAAFVFAGDPSARRRALVAGTLAAVLVAAQIGLGAVYFNSPFPLPFYAKGLNRVYGEAFVERYARVPREQLALFFQSYWIFFALIAADLLFNFRDAIRRSTPWEKGLFLATIFHVVYYLFFVVQVVSLHQRFYHPTLPVLIYLGARSATRLADLTPRSLRDGAASLSVRAQLCGALILLGLLAPPLARSFEEFQREYGHGRTGEFDITERWRQRSSRFWIGLDRLAELPDDVVLATTEVGHPAVMNPGKKVVDLAGLNETVFAHEGFSASRLVNEYRADFIYMPHEDYVLLNGVLRGDAEFQAQYELFEAEDLGVFMAVALRRASPHYARMREILESGRDVGEPLE